MVDRIIERDLSYPGEIAGVFIVIIREDICVSDICFGIKLVHS